MWIGIVFIAIIITAIIVVRIKYPPDKVKELAISELESAINRKVKIGTVWFNPLKGFTLNDVKIYQYSPKDTIITDTTTFFQSKKIHLKYRFLSLVCREIEISDIMIDQPEMNLIQDEYFRWNFDDLIKPDSSAIQPTESDSTKAEISLPLSLKLKNLSLKNFEPSIIIHHKKTVYTLKTGGISLQLDELFLPRKSLEELKQKARATIKIFSEQKPWQFSLETDSLSEKIDISSELQLNVELQLAGLQQIESRGKFALANVFLNISQKKDTLSQQSTVTVPELTSMSFDLTTDADKGTLSLNKLVALFDKETIFDIQGDITDYLNQPSVDLEVKNSNISLLNLLDLFKPLLPDKFKKQLDNFSFKGIASFTGTKIKGNPMSDNIDDALSFNLHFSIDDFSTKYVDPETNLENDLINLTFKSEATGIFNINGVPKTDVSANLALDSIYVAVDTMQLAFKDIKLDFITSLNSQFMPDSLTSSFRIDNFFNVPLDLSLRFKSMDKLNQYQAIGNLRFEDLSLGELPESTMEGFVNCALNLYSESLEQINLELKAESDIIEVQTETGSEPLIFYPMDILGNALLSTDMKFQKIELKQLTTKVSNFASGLIHGDLAFGNQQKLNLVIDNFTIEHDKVLEILPAQFLEGLESLRVTGSSNLTATISAVLPENQHPVINADGQVSINAGIEYPDEFVTLKSIDGQLDFITDGESGKFNLKAILDSLIVAGIQDEPLRDMAVTIDGKFPDLETIYLDSAKMIIPDLMTQVVVTTKIDSLSSENIQLKGNCYLTFDTQGDTVTLLNMLKLSGELSQQAELSLLNNVAEITGQLVINNLNVNYEDLAQIDSICGKIYISQKFDIENEKIIENPLNQSFIAGAGSYYYDLLRPYYQQDRDRFSYLQIAKIKAMDYQATNLNFDFFIHNERIEIPRFSLLAYDGNMSGLIYANLHEGAPDQIEWKVKANLSRLNSAKLIPTRRKESKDSDLNMNLELSGIGIDPASQLDVEGYFYVTKIGPQFTDNVLRSLDPKGTDKSIQDTRKLLNWGYKPKLISFEIKHGNLYPTIHLVKGKFLTKLIPLNLSGGKIELARIPVKFFFQNMMTETR